MRLAALCSGAMPWAMGGGTERRPAGSAIYAHGRRPLDDGDRVDH
jgi:hypothetical protein